MARKGRAVRMGKGQGRGMLQIVPYARGKKRTFSISFAYHSPILILTNRTSAMSHSRDSGWLWICLGATLVLSSSLWDINKFGILYKGVMGERGRDFIDPVGGSFLEEVSYLRAFMRWNLSKRQMLRQFSWSFANCCGAEL